MLRRGSRVRIAVPSGHARVDAFGVRVKFFLIVAGQILYVLKVYFVYFIYLYWPCLDAKFKISKLSCDTCMEY